MGHSLTGTVPGADALKWHEGVSITLEWANDTPWVVIDPTPVIEGVEPENAPIAADFVRGRTVQRYNQALNGLIAFWTSLLAGDRDLSALAIASGVDATFRLGTVNAYSRRVGA